MDAKAQPVYQPAPVVLMAAPQPTTTTTVSMGAPMKETLITGASNNVHTEIMIPTAATTDKIFPIMQCCCTGYSLYYDFNKCCGCMSKGVCLCSAGSSSCHIGDLAVLCYKSNGEISCCDCSDDNVKGAELQLISCNCSKLCCLHSSCQQKCGVPNTCCASGSQCCCLISNCAFPCNDENPFWIACCGVTCAGGRKVAPGNMTVTVQTSHGAADMER